MKDRDSLLEIYEIVQQAVHAQQLPLASDGLQLLRPFFHKGCDTYFRRRLSVCRTLIDLHLPISAERLDILLTVSMVHSLPVDKIPAGYNDAMFNRFSPETRIAEVVDILRQADEAGKSNYRLLQSNGYALMVRLIERGVLVEKLYEWPEEDARRFIRETREFFLPMCLYAKENYPEYIGAASILMEKMRNLCLANEALLNRYEGVERALSNEILSLQEENASLRRMIRSFQEERHG
ncbi:MAG: hypothetical protein MJ135_00415 [Oscillospiraceae bacterium]|nr:hypothetical protein [Oscillospiraceae bacterium]